MDMSYGIRGVAIHLDMLLCRLKFLKTCCKINNSMSHWCDDCFVHEN